MAVIEVSNSIVGPQTGSRPGAVFTVGSGYNYSTITLALAACESGRGDTIFVAPGTYAENVVVTKDYVAIVGLLPGYARPDVVPATGVALVVRAQGFYTDRMRWASDGQDADVVQIEGNGWRFEDETVIDGAAGMGITKALCRIWTHVSDDSYTGSEGYMGAALLRGSPGFGIAFDCQHATVGVLPTDNYFKGVRFVDNAKEDVMVAATAVAVNGIHRTTFDSCLFGGGTGKNKATHIDLTTNKIGTPDTEFIGCFINDDTPDATALKVNAVGTSLIGCTNLDGVINGDALD